MADYLLHEKVFEEFYKIYLQKLKNIPKHKLKILVLGSGKGAFDRRLIDSGFSNIVSIDINAKDYLLKKKTRFIRYDLNQNFSNIGKFDVIFAIEIIEHIHNTYKFLEDCASNLAGGGYLFITTLNIHEKTSRLNMLIFGISPSFSQKALYESGHINPIIDWVFRYFCDNLDLKIIKRTYNRTFFDILPIYSYKSTLYYIFLFLLTLFIGSIYKNKKLADGVISIYIIQKQKYRK